MNLSAKTCVDTFAPKERENSATLWEHFIILVAFAVKVSLSKTGF